MSRFHNAFATTALCLFVIFVFAGTGFAQATETVLYSFGGYPGDGLGPTGGLVSDSGGNLFGTTASGGTVGGCPGDEGCGTAFELSPSPNGWTETILYNFCSTGNPDNCPDGAEPFAGLIFDKSGNLYGTTYAGGVGLGTVFELSPPASGGSWAEKVLWTFTGLDGVWPYYGKLSWDASGNLYGTTIQGGIYDHGTVFELSPQPGGTWTETVLHSFKNSDGAGPEFGVTIDNSGNLYGTAGEGGFINGAYGCPDGCGTVYELAPSGGTWTYEVLYKFTPSGGIYPTGPISIDSHGNLYGTLSAGGPPGCSASCGGVFKLEPKSGGGVTKHTIFFNGQDGANPDSGLLLDEKAGVAFGTTLFGDNVYEVSGTAIRSLYQFCSLPQCADGWSPQDGILQARSGELYGVTKLGGDYYGGVVFSISQ